MTDERMSACMRQGLRMEEVKVKQMGNQRSVPGPDETMIGKEQVEV